MNNKDKFKQSLDELISLLESQVGLGLQSTETVREYVMRISQDRRLIRYREKFLTIVDAYEAFIYGAKKVSSEKVHHLNLVIYEIKDYLRSLQPIETTELSKKSMFIEESVQTKPSEKMEKPVTIRQIERVKMHQMFSEILHSIAMFFPSIYGHMRRKFSDFFKFTRRSPLATTYIAIVLTVGFIIRYHACSVLPVYCDEVSYGLHAFHIYKSLSDPSALLRHSLWTVFVSSYTFHPHPPLYPFLAALVFILEGPSLFSWRFLNLVIATMEIAAFYLLSRKLYNSDLAGVFPSLYVALHPYFIYYTAIVHFYHLETLLVMLFAYYFLNSLNDRRLRNSSIAGIFAGLVLLSNMQGLGILLASLLFLFYLCVRVEPSIPKFDRTSFAMFLLVCVGLFLPIIATSMYQKFVVHSEINIFDTILWISGARSGGGFPDVFHVLKMLPERWLFSFGVYEWRQIPLSVAVFFNLAVLCTLLKPRVSDRLLLSILITWVVSTSLMFRPHPPYTMHVAFACLILLCTGFFEKLSRALGTLASRIVERKVGRPMLRRLLNRGARYLFFGVMLVVVVTPSFGWPEYAGISLNKFMSIQPGGSVEEEMVNYIVQSHPKKAVVLVDLEYLGLYPMKVFQAIQNTNDIYDAHIDPLSNRFSVYPITDWLYFTELYKPKNPIQAPLEGFLRIARLPSLFLFSKANVERYNFALSYLEETGVSFRFLKECHYQWFNNIPLDMYLVYPISSNRTMLNACESTENWKIAYWGEADPEGDILLSTDHKKEGTHSLRCSFRTSDSGEIAAVFHFNPTGIWNWQQKHFLELWIYNPVLCSTYTYRGYPVPLVTLYVYSSHGCFNRYRVAMTFTGWRHISIPLRNPTSISEGGVRDWSSTDAIDFVFFYPTELPRTYEVYLDEIVVSD